MPASIWSDAPKDRGTASPDGDWDVQCVTEQRYAHARCAACLFSGPSLHSPRPVQRTVWRGSFRASLKTGTSASARSVRVETFEGFEEFERIEAFEGFERR